MNRIAASCVPSFAMIQKVRSDNFLFSCFAEILQPTRSLELLFPASRRFLTISRNRLLADFMAVVALQDLSPLSFCSGKRYITAEL